MQKIILLFTWLFVSGMLFQSCAVRSYQPLPQHLEAEVQIPGMPNVRCWGDSRSDYLEQSAITSITQEMKANNGKLEAEVHILALSGGGGDGAFGAGLLNGWTESGTRPTFKLVTGISTGALIAPFAFLGPSYDQKLKEAYTTISDKDIYEEHSIFAIFLSLINVHPLPSLASHKPLVALLNKLIDEKMLQEIAAEHLKGRRLLVGTTQIDSQRLVIWDMGEIACSQAPGALALFHKILIASASLPATLPPEFFNVEAGGKKYTEMHVDGGVEVQVMLFEDALSPLSIVGKWAKIHPRPRHLYIIRNKKVYPEWQYVEPQLKFIAARTIDSLLKSQSIGDLYRLYTYCLRDNTDYNLAFIPEDFDERATSEFDHLYMNKLFTRAHAMAKSGYSWNKYPPGYEAE